MLSIHSGGEVPGVFLIECITDDYLSSTIRSALLKMVTTSDPLIIVAFTTSSLRTIRDFAIDRKGIPIESLQNNLRMRRPL